MSTWEEAEAEEWCIKNGLIERPHDPYDWTDWTSVFRLFPRKSINGKFLWGTMQKRKRAYDEHLYYINSTKAYIYEHQYANEREAFKHSLANGDNNG